MQLYASNESNDALCCTVSPERHLLIGLAISISTFLQMVTVDVNEAASLKFD